MSKQNDKLDIFEVLKQIDLKNAKYVEQMDELQIKQFVPFVIARWLTGSKDPAQTYFINEFVNPYLFHFGTKHKKLLYHLMTVCTSGKINRYKWIKREGSKYTKPISTKVISDYLGYSTTKASQVIDLFTCDDIVQYANELGFQKDQITKIMKEYK